MWGDTKDMQQDLGYDIERRLWDVVSEEGCRLNARSETCIKLMAHIKEVFG
jgi:alpha 1,2-mannosyltransferase